MNDDHERPAELPDVQGAWRRDGRRLHDGPAKEVSDVLWLQAGRLFCDLRTARPGKSPAHGLDMPQAFSGIVEVRNGDIAFHHELDTVARDPSHPDLSTVHRVGETMYERGPGFEERWVLASLPDDHTAVAELREDDGRLLARIVQVGALALAVWGGRLPGGAQFAARNGWVAERASFRDRSVADVDDAARALAFGDPLPPRWAVPATATVL